MKNFIIDNTEISGSIKDYHFERKSTITWINYLIDYNTHKVFWTKKDNRSYFSHENSSCISKIKSLVVTPLKKNMNIILYDDEIKSFIKSSENLNNLLDDWRIYTFELIRDHSLWDGICEDYRMNKLKYLLSFLRECPDEPKYEHEKHLYKIFNIVHEHLELEC